MIIKKYETMKTSYILVLFAALAMIASSCKKKAIYTNFETEYAFKVTVPANALLSSSLFPLSFEEESNSESQYQINDTRKDLLEEVTLKSFLLETVSPQNEDLSFLNSAEFYINADELPETLVAFKDPVPTNVGKDLLFEIRNENMAPFLKKDDFSIRTKVVTDENRTQDITLRGTIKFDVRAKVLGFG